MHYNHDENTITIKARYVDVAFQFNDDEVIEVLLDGWSIPADADCLHGILVDLACGLETKQISIHALMKQVESEYQDLRDESEQEAIDNAYMQREISSPYCSGRV